jgi:hypothetical protein
VQQALQVSERRACQVLGQSRGTQRYVKRPEFHRWRNQYGGMKSEEAKRLKELDDENKRLKKLLADTSSGKSASVAGAQPSRGFRQELSPAKLRQPERRG